MPGDIRVFGLADFMQIGLSKFPLVLPLGEDIGILID